MSVQDGQRDYIFSCFVRSSFPIRTQMMRPSGSGYHGPAPDPHQRPCSTVLPESQLHELSMAMSPNSALAQPYQPSGGERELNCPVCNLPGDDQLRCLYCACRTHFSCAATMPSDSGRTYAVALAITCSRPSSSICKTSVNSHCGYSVRGLSPRLHQCSMACFESERASAVASLLDCLVWSVLDPACIREWFIL